METEAKANPQSKTKQLPLLHMVPRNQSQSKPPLDSSHVQRGGRRGAGGGEGRGLDSYLRLLGVQRKGCYSAGAVTPALCCILCEPVPLPAPHQGIGGGLWSGGCGMLSPNRQQHCWMATMHAPKLLLVQHELNIPVHLSCTKVPTYEGQEGLPNCWRTVVDCAEQSVGKLHVRRPKQLPQP